MTLLYMIGGSIAVGAGIVAGYAGMAVYCRILRDKKPCPCANCCDRDPCMCSHLDYHRLSFCNACKTRLDP